MQRITRLNHLLAALVIALAFCWHTISVASDNLAAGLNDRLLIKNLISSYGYFYDEGHMDEFRSLFTESSRFYGVIPGEEPATLGQVMEFFTPRVAYFKDNGIQRRHILSPVRFETQTRDEAAGQAYMQLYSVKKGGSPEIVLTGYYGFKVVKTDQGWKIDRWQIYADSRIE